MVLVLIVLAFFAAYAASRRSLPAGLIVVFAVGYIWGITRANYQSNYIYFLFDAAVLGLYLGRLFVPVSRDQQNASRSLNYWAIALIAWPAVMLVIPIQDPLVQLVGFRGNAFFLPFLILGSRLQSTDLNRIGLALAVLNLMAFSFGVAEYFFGVERFYPEGPVTDVIYRSKDLADFTAFRIPACFSNASSYGGTMVVSLPFLVGAWGQKSILGWRRWLLTAAIGASIVGVFLAASRSHAVVLFVQILIVTVTGRLSLFSWLVWLAMIAGIIGMVSREERLQRPTSMDSTALTQRFSTSVNMQFLEVIQDYPMGNGLGGGGTSIPSFLQDRLKIKVALENEYARIVLEQGLIGLAIWIAFLIWALTRRSRNPQDPWSPAKLVAWCTCGLYFAMGMTGTGMLTSVPQSGLLLLMTGWVVVRQPQPRQAVVRQRQFVQARA